MSRGQRRLIASIARGFVLAAAAGAGAALRGLFLAARPAHRPAQKLRLLVRRLRLEALPAPWRLLLWRRRGLRRGLQARFGGRRLWTALKGRPLATLAIAVAIAIEVAVAIAEATMIAPERALVAVVVVAAVLARLRMRLGVRRRLEGRLRETALIEQILTIILGELIPALGDIVRPAQALLAVAVVALARLDRK